MVAVCAFAGVYLTPHRGNAQPLRAPEASSVQLPLAPAEFPIEFHAREGSRWQQGQYEVWHLRGNCMLVQGPVSGRAQEAIVWIERPAAGSGSQSKVIAYLETGVVVETKHNRQPHSVSGRAANTIRDNQWIGRLHTSQDVRIHAASQSTATPVRPPIYQRASKQRVESLKQFGTIAGLPATAPIGDSQVRPAQFTAPAINGPPPVQPPVTPGAAFPPPTGPPIALPAAQPDTPRRIIVRPRSNVRVQGRTVIDPETGEQSAVINTGVRVVVEGVAETGKVDFETDRVVIWTAGLAGALKDGENLQPSELPLEFYMEGNIVFRQGDRVIYAERMYYNVAGRYGVVLNAEVLTPAPGYQGLVRLKADVLQQVNEQSFLAQGAAITSSRLGVPQYWLQSETLEFEDIQRPQFDAFTGAPVIDPETGDIAVDHQLQASSNNNFLYVAGVPVLYWPVLATNLNKPTYYIEGVTIRNDSVFGNQILADFDMYQLLGIREPLAGTDWELTLGYLSERGPAAGTIFSYRGDSFAGFEGPVSGSIDLWGIYDTGLDILGADRRALAPEEEFRGRLLAKHRQSMTNGLQVTGELGFISDRNFLEQYFESEWDEQKDQSTGVELKYYLDDQTLSANIDVRVNDFVTQTNWLPRVDHYALGVSLLEDSLTWFSHSRAGYADFQTASTPDDPGEVARTTPLGWEREASGLVAGTRNEIDLPIYLHPVKITPYVLGDISFYENDLTGDDQFRAFGQLGVRGSVSMWAADQGVQSPLFNLNGLAHKVTFESELAYADSNSNLTDLPLYDPLDDDSQEFFRRRFLDSTFLGAAAIPTKFDERFFAFRSNMQGNVTAPSSEIAGDIAYARFDVRQRWQTRRGAPGEERVVDFIKLDVGGAFFPDADRDNFGSVAGMLDYDFRWNIGDRLSVLSDGFFDPFDDGLRTFSLGGTINRPQIGNWYVGYRSIEGPISSNILSTSVSYRMSQKWIVSGGASYDLGPTGNIGQNILFTHIGESLLVRFGFTFDVSRGNVGFALALEPRFLPNSRLSRVGGVQIPPAGALGLE